MPTSPETTRKSLHRWNRQARLYDLLTGPMERILRFAEARRWIFERLEKGRVLEVGAGTGKNLAHYPAGVEMVATDLSPGMLRRAVEKARAGSAGTRFLAMDAEDLAFRNGAFDRVVATFVFCSVPDPVRGLKEVRRVLGEGGEVVLLEHMRPGGFLGVLFDALDPVVSRLAGPHINRRTLDNIRTAGLVLVEERNVFSGWIKIIVAR